MSFLRLYLRKYHNHRPIWK